MSTPVRGGPLLTLPALLYGAAVRLRNRRFDRPGACRRAAVPVVSVGNLTVGGTGKTPVVIWIAQRLAALGRRPAVVSRGYGGRAGRGPRVVSKGRGPELEARVAGDEPWLISRSVRGAVVVVGSDRVAGAKAASELGAEIVLLDDGFQHRRLARDLDVVLLDAEDPFGNGRLLPAGPLREPQSGLARADLILLTRSASEHPLPQTAQRVREQNPNAPLVTARHHAVGFVDLAGHEAEPPDRAIGFCGIGQPESFRKTLLAQGVELVTFESFGDHHRYTPDEIRRLRTTARDADATLVTTEKDLARLDDPRLATGPIVALRIEAAPFEPQRLLDPIVRLIGGTDA